MSAATFRQLWGWEHIGQLSAWHYFRKEAKEEESPGIFTDVESKVAKADFPYKS